MMKKFLILLAMLVAVAVLADSVVAAEAGAKPAAATMEEVDLDEAAADMEDEDYDDEDGGITLDFVINAIPAALLIDMSGNNFGLESAEGRSTASSVYMMPNISVGIGADVNEKVYLDALVGVGVVVNESLRSFFAQATVSATFAASQSLNIGPRIGLIQFMGTEWLDDEALLDEVDFDDSTGLMLGLQIVMGDRIRYLVNIDYITMDFDADLPAGVTADNNGTLEVEGLAVQFGVRGEF